MENLSQVTIATLGEGRIDKIERPGKFRPSRERVIKPRLGDDLSDIAYTDEDGKTFEDHLKEESCR